MTDRAPERVPPREPTALRLLLQAFWPFLGIALLLPFLGVPTEAERKCWPIADVLAAIRAVESGDREDVADGDDGKAIGPYQIHEIYWKDAQKQDANLGGTYKDCRKRAYATTVVTAYMQMHCPKAFADGVAETIARIHNGGPTGAQKAATLGYWQRVRKQLPR